MNQTIPLELIERVTKLGCLFLKHREKNWLVPNINWGNVNYSKHKRGYCFSSIFFESYALTAWGGGFI